MLSCAFCRSLGVSRPRTMTKGEAISLPQLFKYNCNTIGNNRSTICAVGFENTTASVKVVARNVCVFIPISVRDDNIAEDLIGGGGGGAGTQGSTHTYNNK